MMTGLRGIESLGKEICFSLVSAFQYKNSSCKVPLQNRSQLAGAALATMNDPRPRQERAWIRQAPKSVRQFRYVQENVHPTKKTGFR
jgi:hypothetical protein